MKIVRISVFIILCGHCTINVEDLKNKSIEYQAPEYNYLLGVTSKGFYAANKDDLLTWERVGGKEIDLDYSTGETKYIENLLTSHYCNGIWVVVGQVVRVSMEYDRHESGSGARNNIVIYWTDRQSPFTEWNEYEISQEFYDIRLERLIPLDISCNKLSGKWTIAAFHFMMESYNPTNPDSWKTTHVNKIAPSGGLTIKRVEDFENFTYGVFFSWGGDEGYLGLKYDGEPWEFVHVNNDLGAEPHLWHTFLFDPTTNKVVIGTTGSYVVYCEIGTLECNTIPTEVGIDSLATDNKGNFLGVSFTSSTMAKRANVDKWAIDQGVDQIAVPRIYAIHIVNVDGKWLIAGERGGLSYNPYIAPIDPHYTIREDSEWIHIPTGTTYYYDQRPPPSYINHIDKFQNAYNYAVSAGGEHFGGRQFTSLILGGL